MPRAECFFSLRFLIYAALLCLGASLMSSCQCSKSEIARQRNAVLAWKREAAHPWRPGQVVLVDVTRRAISLAADPSSLSDSHALRLISRLKQSKPESPIEFVGVTPKRLPVCYRESLLVKGVSVEKYGAVPELIAALNRTSTGLDYNEDADFRWVGIKSRVRWAIRTAEKQPDEVTVGILRELTKTIAEPNTPSVALRLELETLSFCSPLGNTGAEFESTGVKEFDFTATSIPHVKRSHH